MVANINQGDPWIEAKEKQPEMMRDLNRTAARITLTENVTIQLRYPLDLRRP